MKQPCRDPSRAEHDDGADKEHGAEPGPVGGQAEYGTTEPKGHIEKDGISAHREATTLRRHTAHGFNAESWINQCVAKASERGACRRHNRRGRKPNQSETSCFNKDGNERNFRAAQSVGRMTEEEPCRDQSDRESTEGEPDRAPTTFCGQQRTECDHRAKTHGA